MADINTKIFPTLNNIYFILVWHLSAASTVHAKVSQVLSLISEKVCASSLNSSYHVLSHQPRILDFVQEAELKMGIVQFSGETIAENQFFL